MGIVYKLLPKIKTFIIEQKNKDSNLSCRKVAALILKKFQIKLSKSSVNSIIKQAGLSGPIGRKRKPRRRAALEADSLGAVLLKATDALFGGSIAIAQTIRERLPKAEDPALLEGLLYLPLFKSPDSGELTADSGLWTLIGKKYSQEAIKSYLKDLQGVKLLGADIFRVISQAFQEAWFIKITLSDNSLLYLDGELRTIWSTPHIPYDFSSTLYKSKGYINKFISENSPLILFTAPGYDTPTREFFDLFLTQETGKNKIAKFTLYGSKMEELEVIRVTSYDKKYYIFGLWPWQYERYRKIKINSEFKGFYFEPLQQDFYIAETEIELSQPKLNQIVKLRGGVLKIGSTGKIKVIIATNLPAEKASLETLAISYLNRWPNLEEGFTDFSRKIELHTYTAASRKTFSPQELALRKGDSLTIEEALDYYLRGLDLFLRWRILPSEYEKLDFSTTKERFYRLKSRIKTKQDNQLVSFILPREYAFAKDLAYACLRLNEKQAHLAQGRRLWFMPPRPV